MPVADRPMPPLERRRAQHVGGLAGVLSRHAGRQMRRARRATASAARAAVPGDAARPHQHMAEVERNWFRGFLVGEAAPPIYDRKPTPRGVDGGFDLHDASPSTRARHLAARRSHRREELCRSPSRSDQPVRAAKSRCGGSTAHEWPSTPAHNGHADLIRERIDGARASDHAGGHG